MKKITPLLILNLLLTHSAFGFFVPVNEKNFEATSLNKSNKSSLYLENMAMNVFSIINEKYNDEIKFRIENTSNINAYATFDDQDYPLVSISRGLLEHELTTQETIALMICHELGHFYGGSPKQFRGRTTRLSWSTAEGQSDFYATAICAKKVFEFLPQHENKMNEITQISNELNSICQSHLCIRIGNASYKVAKLYAEIKFWPRKLSVLEKDATIVTTTNRRHPNPQCRLDTMLAGVLCQEIKDLSGSEELFITCMQSQYRQPSCWLSPDYF